MRAEVWFHKDGTRKDTPHGAAYRPHLHIKGTDEYLGVQFDNLVKSRFGEHIICNINPLYTGADYSKLTNGTLFEIKEGRNTVGEGFVME